MPINGQSKDVKVLIMKDMKLIGSQYDKYKWVMISLGDRTLKAANFEIGDKVYLIVFEEEGERHILISKKPPDWLMKSARPTE